MTLPDWEPDPSAPRIPILDQDELYRRLVWQHLSATGAVLRYAFYRDGKPDPEISVDLARLTSEAEALSRAAFPQDGLGTLEVGRVRKIAVDDGTHLEVTHDPLIKPGEPIERHPAHTLITGLATKAECQQLAGLVKILRPPTPRSETG